MSIVPLTESMFAEDLFIYTVFLSELSKDYLFSDPCSL